MIVATLISGLWQGVLIVGITALITTFIPTRHAATRYAVWYCALLALAVVPFVTQFHPGIDELPAPSPVLATVSAPASITARAAAADWSTWIALAWLAGAALGLLRLIVSFARIRAILARAERATSLGSNVVRSSDIRVPIAAGMFRPRIVIPAHVCDTLDAERIGAVIEHERAHIERGDILGNLLQRVIEALLFFNPWVYVIAVQLVREREAACDDWAVQSAPSHAYASTLAQLAAARRASHPLLTPSALGSRRLIVIRIARILDGKVPMLRTNYRIVGATAVTMIALAAAFAAASIVAPTSAAFAANEKLSPKCFADSKIVNAAAPVIPKSHLKAIASANALVTIDTAGKPMNAKIVVSSGDPTIDKATVDAAMASTYTIAMNDCKKQLGHYLFHVQTAPSADGE